MNANDQLIHAFGSLVIYQPDKGGTKPVKAPLGTLLGKVTTLPAILLQGKFDHSTFQNTVLTNIGLDAVQVAQVPPIAGLIPDIIVVRQAVVDDEEVGANGCRRPIDIATETRLALSIIDVKHTSEANPSYSAEVALYAIFLANWIADQGMQNKYFVTIRSYLWTRFKQGQSALDALMAGTPTATPVQYLDALILTARMPIFVSICQRCYISSGKTCFELSPSVMHQLIDGKIWNGMSMAAAARVTGLGTKNGQTRRTKPRLLHSPHTIATQQQN